jgi:hypothetical protein
MPASDTNRFSFLALVSALLALFCVTGPIAAFLGWLALRAINGSDGRLRGHGLAVFGVVAGAIGTVAIGLGTLAIVVNAVRAKSQRTECEYNLGKIALAVNVCFNHSDKKFPAAIMPLPGRPPEEHFSWLAGLLPFLEERPDQTFPWKPLADRLDFDRPWNDPVNLPVDKTNVPRFLCPGHPHFDPRGSPGLTHYVGIAGLGDDAASLPADNRRAGFFGYDRRIGLDDITAGTGNTFLATETTIDNGPWAAGGPPTVRGVDPDETQYIGPGRPFGGCHREGRLELLTAAYVDGSVRFISAAIKPDIFRNSSRISRDPAGK